MSTLTKSQMADPQRQSESAKRIPTPTKLQNLPFASLRQLQRSAGNCAVTRLLQSTGAGAIQTKLSVNQPGDEFELDADRVADQIMRMPEPQLQRNSDNDGDRHQFESQPGRLEEHEHVQTKHVPTGSNIPSAVPTVVDEVLAAPGQPLDSAIRTFFEPRFGLDFSDVRVHLGEAAAQSAQQLNAQAYAVGNNIVFGQGRFAPGTEEGRQLLAHELTHVLQQSRQPTQPTLQRKQENNAGLAAIQGLPMAELLTRLSELPESVLDDEEAGGFVGGPRLVIAMRAVRAKSEKGLVDFLTLNKRQYEALPADQANAILNFFSTPDERKSSKTINTDLEVNLTVADPATTRLPGEKAPPIQVEEGVIHTDEINPETEPISEFEERLLKNRSLITGVVLDPETNEIIGYRTLKNVDGISHFVDREGQLAFYVGVPGSVESEGLGPLDYAPSPTGVAKGVGKAAVGVAGKLFLKGALKKGAATGFKATLGGVMKMRGVARAISAKGAWKGFSKGELAAHFEKHGAEFLGLTQTQYLKAAKEFATAAGKFTEQRVGNILVKYDPVTRKMLIGNVANREIRSFYIADFRDPDPFKAAVELAKKIVEK